MTIKAVIFDLDGTITAFNLDYRAVRVEVRNLLVNAGIPPSVLAVNESIFEMLRKTETFLRNSGKSEAAVRRIRESALTVAEKREFEAAQTTSLLPDVVETLKILKKMKMKIGLCTINNHKSTEHILNRFKIKQYFDATVPRDKVRLVKPNPAHLLVTLEALNVKPKATIIVGDGGADMRCGKGLGILAVGLTTGSSSQEELISNGANYLVTSMTELPILINSIDKAMKRNRDGKGNSGLARSSI